MNESKKLWEIAGPSKSASVSEFFISFITTAFVDHLGELEFAAVFVSQNAMKLDVLRKHTTQPDIFHGEFTIRRSMWVGSQPTKSIHNSTRYFLNVQD